MFHSKINNFSKKGFTIVELLIAMGVFMFLMIATFGIYTVAIQRHYQAQKSQVVNQELRYSTELMLRDIRDSLVKSKSSTTNVYYIYLASKNKLKNSQGLDPSQAYLTCVSGINSSCLTYKIDSSVNANGTPTATNGIWAKNGPYDSDFVRLTSQNVQILSASKFEVEASSAAQDNPRVTIFIDAKEKNDTKDISRIYLQTTSTQKEVKQNIFTF